MYISWFLIWGLLDELMPCPFIRHVKCATFRSLCNDGDKSKQWGLFYAGLGEGDYGIICHFPFLNHISALRYHLARSGKKQGAVILYSSGSYCYFLSCTEIPCVCLYVLFVPSAFRFYPPFGDFECLYRWILSAYLSLLIIFLPFCFIYADPRCDSRLFSGAFA